MLKKYFGQNQPLKTYSNFNEFNTVLSMRLLIVRSTLMTQYGNYQHISLKEIVYVVILFQVYSKSNEWKLLAKWSVSFSNETKVYDETDSKLLNLVSFSFFFLY